MLVILYKYFIQLKEVLYNMSQNPCINYNFFKRCYSVENEHFEHL